MKKLLVLTLFLSLVGCTGSTPYGKCIGMFQDPDPTKEYEMDMMNIILGAIFVETIIAPVVVVVDRTYCPVGDKK